MNLDFLVNQASAKTGVNANELKAQIQSGKLNQVMSQLSPVQAKMLQNALNNPQVAQQLLNTPQAKNLIQQFMKK